MRAHKRLWVVASILALATAGAWLSARRRSEARTGTVDLTDGRPKLFDLGMGICEQCRRMRPVMARAAQELGGRLEVHVLDIREEPGARIAERYRMRVMPLVVLADGAGAELWRHEGFVDFPELSQAVLERLDVAGVSLHRKLKE